MRRALVLLLVLAVPVADAADPVPSSQSARPAARAITLSVEGLGPAETAWFQARAAGIASAAEATHMGNVSGLLRVSYENQRLEVWLVQSDFDPAGFVVEDYPSRWLVYDVRGLTRPLQFITLWLRNAVADRPPPPTLSAELASVLGGGMYAAFAQQDRPGELLVANGYASGWDIQVIPTLLFVTKAGENTFIKPIEHRRNLWAMPGMVAPDGREASAANLWRFMGWDVKYPSRTGLP